MEVNPLLATVRPRLSRTILAVARIPAAFKSTLALFLCFWERGFVYMSHPSHGVSADTGCTFGSSRAPATGNCCQNATVAFAPHLPRARVAGTQLTGASLDGPGGDHDEESVFTGGNCPCCCRILGMQHLPYRRLVHPRRQMLPAAGLLARNAAGNDDDAWLAPNDARWS